MRIGVYICHCGGNISEVVDVKEVTSFASGQPDVVIARDHEHMCSELGQRMVIDDIKEYKLDSVVVAACSPHFHEKTFGTTLETAGLSPYMLEMANIREQCAWPHFNAPEEATKKASDLVSMAISKARLNTPLSKRTMPIGKRALVIGAGISGIQAALDLGDAGFEVYLVEEKPTIGGKMAQLSRTFPTEDCAACILSPKMADVPANPNITLFDYSEVESISGYLGNYEVTIKRKPRYVSVDKCVSCGICVEKCPVKVPNEFSEGLDYRKAIYVPCDFAVPYKYLIDESVCLKLTKNKCGVCEKVCPVDAIEFDQEPQKVNFTVDTIIVATGYDIFDATQKKVYGYGKYENVITALQMERIIVSISQGAPLRNVGKRIAFIQCVGSRDEQIDRINCSRVCCMYATKLAQLLKAGDSTRDIYIFYTDLRAYGKGFEEYYRRAQETGVKFIRGRVAEVFENSKDKKLTLKVEDTLTRQIIESQFDTVVLSVGLLPSKGTDKIAEVLNLAKSTDGFLKEAHIKFKPIDTLKDGVFICGCAQGPKDIPDSVAQASGAAARAMRLMSKDEYETEPITAFVHDELCDACAECVNHCPVGAITISGVAKINEALCLGCGSCLAYCPKSALDLHYYRDKQLTVQIEYALKSKQDGEVRVVVFADDTCTYTVADSVGTGKMDYSINSRVIRIPSASRITPELMLKAFQLGADGIFLGDCEEKSSPYPSSSEVIKDNITKARNILEKEGLEADRIRFTPFVTVMLGGFVKNVNSLVEFVKRAGPIKEDKRGKLGNRRYREQ